MPSSVFDAIVGHERALAPLRRGVADGRLHPSLLFHGPEGVGKRLAAFALAAALNCARPDAAGCGECSACRRILKGHEEARLKSPEQRRAHDEPPQGCQGRTGRPTSRCRLLSQARS